MTKQEEVYKFVAERGYTKGYTKEQFAVRQVIKLIEELGELASAIRPAVHGWALQELLDDMSFMGELAREAFDRNQDWALRDVPVPLNEDKEVQEEVGDMQVVLWCLAQSLGFESGDVAYEKSKADRDRGVRAEKEAQ